MNEKDYLDGFRRCRHEIEDLRKDKRELLIEVNAMNKVLNAVNCHKPNNKQNRCSEDIVWIIKQIEKDLEEKVKEL